MKFQILCSLGALVSLAVSHTTFVQLEVGGTLHPVGYGIRDPGYDGPINDVTSNDVACNGGPNPTTPSNYIFNITAGSTVKAIWRHALSSTPQNDAIYVVDPSHKGPVMAYMKKVTNSLTDPGYGDGWFKIQEAGLNVATQDWAVTDLIANGGNHSITIPSCLENGQYLLRPELIALHGASSPAGAQLYMECAQINIAGGTGTANPDTVSLPGAYSASDPGILINIYQTLTSYVIPGPPVFTCGSGTSVSNGSHPTTTGKSTSQSSMTTKKSTSTSSSSTKAAPTGAALYGQCGGIGWTGPTTCAQGTCKVTSSYYSQCSL